MRMHTTTEREDEGKKRTTYLSCIQQHTNINLPASVLSTESITHYSRHFAHVQPFSASLTEASMREAV